MHFLSLLHHTTIIFGTFSYQACQCPWTATFTAATCPSIGWPALQRG